MANKKIIERKQQTVEEIIEKAKNSSCVVLFENQGLTVSETNELRKELRKNGSDFKIYKNTLAKRAMDELKIDFDAELQGPKALAFGTDAIAPIKVLNDFANKTKKLEMKIGFVDGTVADQAMLNTLANIPSREQLLTMLAGGLMQTVKDFAICLDLHSQNLENN